MHAAMTNGIIEVLSVCGNEKWHYRSVECAAMNGKWGNDIEGLNVYNSENRL